MIIVTFATQDANLIGIGANFSEAYFGGGFPHYRKGVDPSDGKFKYATIPFFLESYYQDRDEGEDWDSRYTRSHNFIRQIAKTFDFDWVGDGGDGGCSMIPYFPEVFGNKPRPKDGSFSAHPAGNGDNGFNDPHPTENLVPWKELCKCHEVTKRHEPHCWFAKLDKRFRSGDEEAARILAQYYRGIRSDETTTASCAMKGCQKTGLVNFSCVKCDSKEIRLFWCSDCILKVANAGAQPLEKPRRIPITHEASELVKGLALSCPKCNL